MISHFVILRLIDSLSCLNFISRKIQLHHSSYNLSHLKECKWINEISFIEVLQLIDSRPYLNSISRKIQLHHPSWSWHSEHPLQWIFAVLKKYRGSDLFAGIFRGVWFFFRADQVRKELKSSGFSGALPFCKILSTKFFDVSLRHQTTKDITSTSIEF